MNDKVFKRRFVVEQDSIDDLNHVNNLEYLMWCLEAAEAHWHHIAPEELRERFAWVVLRHEIDYKEAALLGDELEIQTWVSTADGVRSDRNYRIVKSSNNAVVIEARTSWCLLDAASHRPTKITEEIRTLFL